MPLQASWGESVQKHSVEMVEGEILSGIGTALKPRSNLLSYF